MKEPIRTIEIIRCWADGSGPGTWDVKAYEFPGHPADPWPSQDEIIQNVLENEPLGTNEYLAAACLYNTWRLPHNENDLAAWEKANAQAMNDPDACDPETWHQSGYYDGSDYDA